MRTVNIRINFDREDCVASFANERCEVYYRVRMCQYQSYSGVYVWATVTNISCISATSQLKLNYSNIKNTVIFINDGECIHLVDEYERN